jgi:acetyl-CoA synthetase
MSIDYGAACERFEWDVPDEYSLPSTIESHADTFGDRVAVRFLSAEGDRVERTYEDLRRGMNRFANALADRGVGPGDRVMHLFPRHPDAFAIQLGALKRGALLVPCSSMLKPKDIAFRASDCEASTVVAHVSLTDMVDPVLDETPLTNTICLDGDPDGWESFSGLVTEQSATHDGPDVGGRTRCRSTTPRGRRASRSRCCTNTAGCGVSSSSTPRTGGGCRATRTSPTN